MFEFVRRLFTRQPPAQDLSLWPYPLGPADIDHLVHYAIHLTRMVQPQCEHDMVAMMTNPHPLEARIRPARTPPIMTPDDLESFGLNRRLKLSARFFLCLNARGRENPLAAEARMIRAAICAIGNRRDLNRLVQEISPKQFVRLAIDDQTACAQARSFKARTWASVAPDLPLPGCGTELCLCLHAAEFDD